MEKTLHIYKKRERRKEREMKTYNPKFGDNVKQPEVSNTDSLKRYKIVQRIWKTDNFYKVKITHTILS